MRNQTVEKYVKLKHELETITAQIQMKTPLVVFNHFSGHVSLIEVNVAKSDKQYDQKVFPKTLIEKKYARIYVDLDSRAARRSTYRKLRQLIDRLKDFYNENIVR